MEIINLNVCVLAITYGNISISIFCICLLVPKDKLKTHDDHEPAKKDTANKKKSKTKPVLSLPQTQDYYFKDFRKLCLSLSQENSHLQKTSIFKEFIQNILSKGMFYKLLYM